MKKVLFIGDINVDIIMRGLTFPIKIDREITCQSYELTIGSSAVIAACVYASLGGKAHFLGLAGKDEHGDFMIEEMNKYDVNTDLVQRTDKTKTGVTVNLIYRDTRTQITYPGTISEFKGSDIGNTVLENFDHIHFAGPYQQIKFSPEITRILEIAKKQQIQTSLDPQWDQNEKWERIDEWLPMLTYLFVNKAEAISISRSSSIEEALKYLNARTNYTIIKAGSKGAFICSNGHHANIPTSCAEVVDTTGAGDNFNSGFLFAVLEKEMDLFNACKFANAVGSRSCLFAGGVNKSTKYRDILKFMEDN